MSYKITSLSIANRPIFKISSKNPLISHFFFSFSPFFFFPPEFTPHYDGGAGMTKRKTLP